MTTVKRTTKLPLSKAKEAATLFWLHQAHHGVRGEILSGFRRAGRDLTSEQWNVLNYLWQARSATQTEIAQHTGRDKPAVTRLLNALESNGYIKREAINRRTNKIELTEQGVRLHDLMFPIFESVLDKILADISSEDLIVAGRVLKVIARATRKTEPTP